MEDNADHFADAEDEKDPSEEGSGDDLMENMEE